MKKSAFLPLLLFVSLIFALFLLHPTSVQQSAYESILFCVTVLIPSLFPGFVLSELLLALLTGTEYHREGKTFFGYPAPVWGCLAIGFLSGFPAAADYASRLAKNGCISNDVAGRCLGFTNNAGAVFVICAVGGAIFGSLRIGLYLWAIQAASSLSVALIFAPKPQPLAAVKPTARGNINLKELFPRAVVSSVSSVLNVCGFVIFFRVLIRVVSGGVKGDWFRIFLSGILEMTCGISELEDFSFLGAILASTILGWSGLSVHFQILNTVSASALPVKYYFPGKTVQAILGGGLTAVTYGLFFGSGIFTPTVSVIILITYVILQLFFFKLKEISWKTKSFGSNRNG